MTVTRGSVGLSLSGTVRVSRNCGRGGQRLVTCNVEGPSQQSAEGRVRVGPGVGAPSQLPSLPKQMTNLLAESAASE